MSTLTKEQQAAIDNYGKEIRTLDDFVMAVRKVPGMYIGHKGNKGFRNMCREIWQNSIDQILDAESPGNWFSFFYDMRSLEVKVEDNGKGLPPNDIIRILTENHTSKNFDKKPGQYSSGLHGSGSKIVNALSTTYIVESYKYDGTAVRLEFFKGHPTTKKPVSIPNKTKKQGLYTYFVPDLDIMGEVNLDWRKLYNLIKVMMSLTPIGSRMDFEAIDLSGKSYKETIINTDGIITDLIMKTAKPINAPIIISADDGWHKLDLAFCYDAGEEAPEDKESITSFANFCPTIDGSHVEGCLKGITKWFSRYMNTIYLANQKAKDKLKITSSDIKTGLNGIIAAAHLEPVLTGQSKELMDNEDMIPFCEEVCYKGLEEWSKANPQDLAKLAKFFKEVAEMRLKNESGRAKISQKFQSNATNNYPVKYKRPLQNKNVELIIVEGDSAAGTVELGRNPETQGIMPIRGKIINAFGNTREKVFDNEEVQAITQIILGGPYRKDFKLEDVKVEKVIFMTDADVDGANIAALLLRLFVMYFPLLIEAGMVYKAVPPLFSTKVGSKAKYFTEQIDIVKYIQKDFLSKHTFTDANNKSLDSKEITKFFLRNADYTYYTHKVANTYAVDPYLLEMVLYNYVTNKNKIDAKKLQKSIKSVYRFMDVEMQNGIPIVRGTIEQSNLIPCIDKFFHDCRYIFDIIDKNDSLYYKIDNKKLSLYQIMSLYEESTPSNIQRYKGLGEMDENELAESTLYPGSNRTLIRYTIDDIAQTTKIIREYESNTKKILQHVDLVTRNDLIE